MDFRTLVAAARRSGPRATPYLVELRVEYDALCLQTLTALAARTTSPKLIRAARRICALAHELPPYRTL